MKKSNKQRIEKVKRSGLVPEEYKEIYRKDVEELVNDIEVNNEIVVKGFKDDVRFILGYLS